LAAPADKKSLQTASKILTSLLLLFTHLLLLLSTFGPPYLPLVTTILLPPRFQSTSAPAILRPYVFYIPMMAFNGILEAFFASTSTAADLRSQSRWMMAFSVGFITTAVVLNKTGFGDSGLVYANILNLCARVIYCWTFVKKYFSTKGGTITWTEAIPPKGVLGVFALSAVATRWSWKTYEGATLHIMQQKGHLAVGVGWVAVCLCTW
jgi:oligosaccharide translocation protein RFT1